MDAALRTCFATIAGEAIGCSPATWRGIASLAMNRVGKREWKRFLTPLAVFVNSRFDAFDQKTDEYRKAWVALEAWPAGHSTLGQLVVATLPILQGTIKPITEAVLYFSPKAQASLHAKHPDAWPARPRWDFSKLEEVFVAGAESDDIMWYRYKAGA